MMLSYHLFIIPLFILQLNHSLYLQTGILNNITNSSIKNSTYCTCGQFGTGFVSKPNNSSVINEIELLCDDMSSNSSTDKKINGNSPSKIECPSGEFIIGFNQQIKDNYLSALTIQCSDILENEKHILSLPNNVNYTDNFIACPYSSYVCGYGYSQKQNKNYLLRDIELYCCKEQDVNDHGYQELPCNETETERQQYAVYIIIGLFIIGILLVVLICWRITSKHKKWFREQKVADLSPTISDIEVLKEGPPTLWNDIKHPSITGTVTATRSEGAPRTMKPAYSKEPDVPDRMNTISSIDRYKHIPASPGSRDILNDIFVEDMEDGNQGRKYKFCTTVCDDILNEIQRTLRYFDDASIDKPEELKENVKSYTEYTALPVIEESEDDDDNEKNEEHKKDKEDVVDVALDMIEHNKSLINNCLESMEQIEKDSDSKIEYDEYVEVYNNKENKNELKYDTESDNDYDDDEDEDIEDIGIYSFGIKWEYWNKTKVTKRYFVEKAYRDLKEELLNNNIYPISITDWDNSWKKADTYLSSEKGRNIAFNGSTLINQYKTVNKNDRFDAQHMISIVIYCNYDKLQYEFTRTFRAVLPHQKLQDIKKRNKQYANWSRLMRESVELYGIKMRNTPNITFYHGITNTVLFPTTIAKFNSPTSLTTALPVAVSFCGGTGLILELKAYGLDVTYFDCQWISDYQSEQERIICGGFQPFIIKDITLISNAISNKKYIKAINIILSIISKRFNPEININDNIIQIIESFMNLNDNYNDRNNKIPKYALQLFQCITTKWIEPINISIPRLFNKDYYLKLQSIFIKEDFFNLELICNVFINCPKITIGGKYGNDGIKLTHKLFNKMFIFLERLQMNQVNNDNNNNNKVLSKLNQIVLESPNETQLKAIDVINNNKWQQQFESINFRILYEEIDVRNAGISSIYITKTDKITTN